MSKTYARGRLSPKNLQHLKDLSKARHLPMLQQLPKADDVAWDSRQQGWIGPVKDQADCGSCWDFSGTGVVEAAYNKAGLGGGPTVMILSEEYTLSCGRNGGCDGDDNTTVLDWAKQTGLPLSSAYGPYTQESDRCAYKSSMMLYKIDDWGFADPSNQDGVGSTQAIKNAIKAYGCVGAAIAADDAFMNNPAGSVFQGSGSRSIDHDIILCGWDDSKGAWLLRNSWGTSWCDSGYCWIKYGANLVGTEAVWAVVNNPNPPAPTPTPTPVPPPSPTPVPPGPTPTPTPGTLQQEVDAILADIRARYTDQPLVVAGTYVLQLLLDAYLTNGFAQKNKVNPKDPIWGKMGEWTMFNPDGTRKV